MDRDEIVVPRASGEAVFSGFMEKWQWDLKMDKMVKRGRLSIHLQKASQLSKEWGEGQISQLCCSLISVSSNKTSIFRGEGHIFCPSKT